MPTRVASVATQGAMQQCQAEACSTTPASSQEIVAIQPNNSVHQSQKRHQRNNGANSVSGTIGANCRMNNNTYCGGNGSSGNSSNNCITGIGCSKGIDCSAKSGNSRDCSSDSRCWSGRNNCNNSCVSGASIGAAANAETVAAPIATAASASAALPLLMLQQEAVKDTV